MTAGSKGNSVAQRVVVHMTDDIDGKPAAETVTFGLDGRSYEIDLSDRNAKALRKAFAPWVASARKVSTRRPRPARAGTDPQAVRAWAASQGIDVAPRGRIAGEVVELYRAAGN
jgi:hypothetical protein